MFPGPVVDLSDSSPSVRRASAVGEHNLGRLSEESFERKGDYEALLFEGRRHRSGELFERSRRIAAGLAELGLAAGDRVVITMANCPEVTIMYQALWRAGLVVTPATFLLPVPDLRHVIANAEASAIVTTPEFVPKVKEAVDGLEHVKFVLCTEEGEDGVLSLASLEDAEPREIVARDDDDLAALLYTGGTTGRSKGVMLSHSNLHFSGRSAMASSHVPGVNRAIATLPLSHAYGLLVTIAGIHNPEPGFSVLLRWFDPKALLESIQEHSLQTSALVPSMLQILLTMPLEDYDLSSLRYVGSGGAPLAPETEEEFRRRVPSVSIRQGYGLTETAALISTNPVGRERRGSVGLPVPDTEVEIRDDEGNALPAGEVGEICCRSPGVMRGYWRSPEVTDEAIRDGWLLHRGRRLRRRRRVPVHRRSQEGPDHPRGLQRLPARCRGRPRRAPGGADGGRRRPSERHSRGGGGRVRGASRRVRRRARRARDVGEGADRWIQVPARDHAGRRGAADPGRQDRPQGAAGPRHRLTATAAG